MKRTKASQNEVGAAKTTHKTAEPKAMECGPEDPATTWKELVELLAEAGRTAQSTESTGGHHEMGEAVLESSAS
jgi:hypothetical protein